MSLLLQGGTVITHDDQNKISVIKADILIRGNRIAQVAPEITSTENCEVVDCTNKVISPGFIDTHHHVWESALKGLFGDMAFFPYLAKMTAAGWHFSPEEMFWGHLAGSMEAIDAGTTTMLDHAHMNWSEEHSKSGLAGTYSSGIRGIFAYTPIVPLTEVQPVAKFATEILPPWVMEAFERFAKSDPLTDPDGRIQLGFGFDMYYLPREIIEEVFAKVRSLGVNIITSHFVRHLEGTSESVVSLLKSYGLLGKGVILSHAGGADADDIVNIRDKDCFIASTPSTELSMAVGPCAFNDDPSSLGENYALGIDCHSATSSSMINEMRVALQSARGIDSKVQAKTGKYRQNLYPTTADVFNLATIQGARALGMERDIGSIKEGKKADLVIFDAMSPAMIAAAQQDPVMAIVMHASTGDIDTVIIDGQIRKRHGKLLSVTAAQWQSEKALALTEQQITWEEVASRILKTQKEFLDKVPEYNVEGIEVAYRKEYGVTS